MWYTKSHVRGNLILTTAVYIAIETKPKHTLKWNKAEIINQDRNHNDVQIKELIAI